MHDVTLEDYQMIRSCYRRAMPMSAQFEYTVSDGVHTLNPTTFTITLIDPLETTGPSFTNPYPTIHVTQGGAAPIGKSHSHL